MAKPRPEKKPEPPANATKRVPPMELRIGDRITDETGEWEVIGRPFHDGGREKCPRPRAEGEPARGYRPTELGARTSGST
jgi:hypothetical protein